jgi:hypothetical protein
MTGTNILINQGHKKLPLFVLATCLRFSGLVALWHLQRLRKAVHLQQTDISAFSADASFLPLPVLMILAFGLKKILQTNVSKGFPTGVFQCSAPVDGTTSALLK